MSNLTHRLKLTLTVTLTVSLAIAIVLGGVLAVIKNQALDRRHQDLLHCVDRVSKEYVGPSSLIDAQSDFPGIDVYIFSSEGNLLDSTGGRAPKSEVGFRKLKDELRLGLKAKGRVFLGISSWKETEAGLHQFGIMLGLLWIPLTAMTALSAWIAGGLALRPVRDLVESAERISSSQEELDLSTSDTAEYAILVSSLNRLIARVRHAAHTQEQFAADAAHELRSPLSILRTRIEANLMRERSVEDHIQSQKKMLIQVDRLTSIVDALLRSARHESGVAANLNVLETVQAICALWAEEAEIGPDQLKVAGVTLHSQIDEEELSVVLSNLLENARRHTPRGTAIRVDVSADGEFAKITVSDNGPGISASHRSQVFERFYRPEQSRNSELGGAGIGLAIVRRIAEMRGGSVQMDDVEVGTSVSVRLPISA